MTTAAWVAVVVLLTTFPTDKQPAKVSSAALGNFATRAECEEFREVFVFILNNERPRPLVLVLECKQLPQKA